MECDIDNIKNNLIEMIGEISPSKKDNMSGFATECNQILTVFSAREMLYFFYEIEEFYDIKFEDSEISVELFQSLDVLVSRIKQKLS